MGNITIVILSSLLTSGVLAKGEFNKLPQAKTKSVRPDLRPLRSVEISAFQTICSTSYSLTYTIDSEEHKVNYS
ncbi:hypothetical protein [Maribacter spongiicola]|uniref:hypothetical protein n=1 Tax=Maribacter spongiicola TaxID=1206753 RepID=UPI001061BF03|nr:hypothetical protein [Maribacter spongiicola]